jgi:hypothetical protein
MNRRLRLTLLAMLLLTLPHAWAHQQKEAITRVLFNPRTDNIEVMHRFLLHDAEHAVKQLRNGEANILDSRDDQEFFSNYVHQRFTITDQDNRVLPLQAVGHEIEGRFLWVYAETAIPKDIVSLSMRHDALRDIWPEQVNLVNVERNGDVKSATFMGGSRELTIDLTPR